MPRRSAAMHAGLSLIFQNLDGRLGDAEMFRHELALPRGPRRLGSIRCVAKLLDYVERTDAGAVLANLSYGGMPYDEAYANFDLYASEVLPVLQALDVGGDIGVTYRPGQQRLIVTDDSGTNGDGVPVGLLP